MIVSKLNQCLLFWIIISVIHGCNGSRSNAVLEISEMVRRMVSHRTYNRDIRPDFGGPPLQINVSLFIHEIDEISDINMDFTVDLHFRQNWIDSRLSFKPVENITKLSLGGDFHKLIWLPDTFFLNGKSLLVHTSTVSRPTTLIELNQDGSILYTTRLTVVASCAMNLTFFPSDQQKCALDFGSYGYTTEDIVYEWNMMDGDCIEGGDFDIFSVISVDRTKKIRRNAVGEFSHLVLHISFERVIGFYLYHTYIPSFLIVLISWIPFWLGHDDRVERVAIGVTTVLTITTLITSTLESLPKISYVKALDVYLFVCFLMVFFSLIEYALVGYYEHVRKIKFIHQCICKKILPRQKMNEQQSSLENNSPILESTIYIDDTSNIDRCSRIIFPLVFVCFNLAYILFIIYFT